MTRFEALFIKYLRVRLDGSWRWVAAKHTQRYIAHKPFTYESTIGGNQIEGLELCNQAMKLLKEKVEDGWN